MQDTQFGPMRKHTRSILFILAALIASSDGAVGQEFSRIPGGKFAMGTDNVPIIHDAPNIGVTVNSFYIAKTETTKALWDSVRAWGLANGYTDLPEGGGKAPNHRSSP